MGLIIDSHVWKENYGRRNSAYTPNQEINLSPVERYSEKQINNLKNKFLFFLYTCTLCTNFVRMTS